MIALGKSFLRNQRKNYSLKIKTLGLYVILTSSLFVISTALVSYAQEESNSYDYISSITPINDTIGLEKTTLTFTIPKDNTHPWGYIDGKIKNHVPHHPVIIQIYDSDDMDKMNGNNIGAVHFAQTNVDSDGAYNYRFRILDTQDGNIINFFEGQYIVKIFSVVYLDSDYINSDNDVV